MLVIPSIITASHDDLARKLKDTEDFSSAVQIDFFDNQFVPGYKSLAPDDFATVETELELIAHILAYSPEDLLASLKNNGFSRAIFHLETTRSAKRVIDLARETGIEIGAAITPKSKPTLLEPFFDDINEILFLGVDPKHPGVFRPEIIERVETWSRTHARRPTISIDGGLNRDNITQAAGSGADIAYVGMAVYGHGHPAENYRRLVELTS